ncbi:MAG TPA: hypothetical protein VJT72_08680 [Pseudonocardiaceae bacterium]|nr:hypothetical protein [Pseudonocardiaceae bacterium]
MNSWIEGFLDVEDMRRRCAAHDRWMAAHPEAVAFAEAWTDYISTSWESIEQSPAAR